MEYKYSNKNNNIENIVFSNNRVLNFIFAIGFFNLLYVFLFGLPSLEVLSYLHLTSFTFTCACSLLFIYFLLHILLVEIILEKTNHLIK